MISLLPTRISIVMVREKLTFISPLREYQLNLKKYFKEEYTLDEIENVLHDMEEAHICNQVEIEKGILEIEEDELLN